MPGLRRSTSSLSPLHSSVWWGTTPSDLRNPSCIVCYSGLKYDQQYDYQSWWWVSTTGGVFKGNRSWRIYGRVVDSVNSPVQLV